MKYLVFPFLLLLSVHKVNACVLSLFYAPINSQVDAVEWTPGKSNIPLSVDDAISIFEQNKNKIVPYILSFDDNEFSDPVRDNTATIDTNIHEIVLESYPFWFYKISFGLNVNFGEYKYNVYQHGLNVMTSKSSPYIGIALDGTILYPQFSTCG